MNRDLFGEIWNRPAKTDAELKRERRRMSERPRGYAGIPGNGPEGETCKTCRHRTDVRFAKKYIKCELNRANWTGGPKTDIRARSPACEKWEPCE